MCAVCGRDLDKQEAEIKEKLKQEKKREERKNREAFSDLLREDMDEGFIKPKMRWRVCQCLICMKHTPIVFTTLTELSHSFPHYSNLTIRNLFAAVLHICMCCTAGRLRTCCTTVTSKCFCECLAQVSCHTTHLLIPRLSQRP